MKLAPIIPSPWVFCVIRQLLSNRNVNLVALIQGLHRLHRNCGVSEIASFGADVSHLPGYSQNNHDHQRVSPPILPRVHHYGPTLWQQRMSHLSQKARFKAESQSRSELRRFDSQNLSLAGRVRALSGAGSRQAQQDLRTGFRIIHRRRSESSGVEQETGLFLFQKPVLHNNFCVT